VRAGKVEAKGGKEAASAPFLSITYCARLSVHEGEAVATHVEVPFHFVLFRLVYAVSAFWTSKLAHSYPSDSLTLAIVCSTA
jgi:hypothetical protein